MYQAPRNNLFEDLRRDLISYQTLREQLAHVAKDKTPLTKGTMWFLHDAYILTFRAQFSVYL